MRLTLKLTLGILILNASILGMAIGQRNWRSTDLGQTLRLSETDCGRDCWFGITTGETMNWRDVQANIEAGGGKYVRFRGGVMRLSLPEPENENFNIGHVQVIFDDEGTPIQTCFFVNQFSIGDVLTTFGEPEYFWFNTNSQRFNFGVSINQPETYFIDYQMIYPDEAIVIEGNVELAFNTDLPANVDGEIPIHPSLPVDLMCTPGNLNYYTLARLPKWQGIYQDIEDYTAFPPSTITTTTNAAPPPPSPPTTNQPQG